MSSQNNLTPIDKKLSCKKCCKTIAKTRRFISCQQCESNFHIKCFNEEPSTSKTNNTNLPVTCSQCKLKNKKCGKCAKTTGKNHRYINCSYVLENFI